jgi:serine/threonine protein kinase
MNTSSRGVSSSTIDARQVLIDDVCDRFDSSWKILDGEPAAQLPRIEDYLAGWQEPDYSILLRELISIDVVHHHMRGLQVSMEQYEQRFPNHVTIVRAVLSSATATWKNAPKAQDTRHWIGKYRVIRPLGRGGQATTHLVFDPDLQRQVVIKQYHATGNAIEREAVLNEGRSLARVKSSYVAQCLNVERTGNDIYLVMEYIRGSNLSTAMRETSIGYRRAAELVAQVAQGLGDVHVCGLLHRDIKPANIIVCEDGTCRLVDFGLATPMTSESLEQVGGTLQYMSPEQARADVDQIDQRSDVFGLGAVFYHLLTGRAPYDADSKSQLWSKAQSGRFEPPRAINPEIPERLELICLTAMAPNPAKRFKSADALGRALRRYLRATRDEDAAPVAGSESSPPLAANPYKGLEAFSEDDAPLFFGRDEHIERLWNSFRELHAEQAIQSETPRILPIVGPSGCGKSSLTRAGLIAELKRRPLPGRDKMRFVAITPGSRPLESLAATLARLATRDPSPVSKTREFEEQLGIKNSNGEFDGLRRIADLLPQPELPLLLMIDQFEEVYFCAEPDDRQAFIESLFLAASDRSARVSVVFTLRSDFIGQTQDNPALNALLSEKGLLVPAMSESELRAAVTEPAIQAERPLEDAVVELLVNDTKGRPGSLPLLQFALCRIWEGLREGTDPGETLRAIGGVGGALAGEAQRIFASLTPQDQRIARRAFLAMVQLGEGTRDTRRRALIRQIAAASDDPTTVHGVLSRFATPAARLVTLSAGEDGEDRVEISHEALLDNWPALQQWLDEGRDDMRFHRRLDDAARHWHEESRPEGLLWRSPDLDYLRQFHARAADEMTSVQTMFYAESAERDESEKRKSRRRLRIYQSAALAIAVLACAATFFGVKSRRETTKAIAAERQAKEQSAAAVDSLFVLARAASEGLADRPDQKETRKLLFRTVIQLVDRVGPGWEEGTSKDVLTAAGHRYEGDLQMENGSFQQALAAYEKSGQNLLPTLHAPKYQEGREWEPLYNLARIEDKLGDAERQLKNYDRSQAHYEAGYEYRKQWHQTGERTENVQQELATSAGNFGNLYKDKGQPRRALRYYEDSLEARRKLLQADPTSIDRKRNLGGAIRAVASQHSSLGDYPRAIEQLAEAIGLFEGIIQQNGDNDLGVGANLAVFQTDLGQAYEFSGDAPRAIDVYRRAVERLRRYHEADRNSNPLRVAYWRALYRLATATLKTEPAAAQAIFDRALQVVRPQSAWQIWTLARCGQFHQADALAKTLAAEYADKPRDLYDVACGYALLASSVKTDAEVKPNDDQQSRADEYTKPAVECLRKAISIGYNCPGELRDNPDLAGIRDLPEFQTLIRELK